MVMKFVADCGGAAIWIVLDVCFVCVPFVVGGAGVAVVVAVVAAVDDTVVQELLFKSKLLLLYVKHPLVPT